MVAEKWSMVKNNLAYRFPKKLKHPNQLTER